MQAQEFFQQQLGPPQGYSDAKVAGDHFMVEDLLDFSNDDVDADITDQTFDAIATGGSTESSTVTAVDSCNSNSSSSGPEFQLVADFGNTQFFGDLSVPELHVSADKLCDDWAELEWLSNFVEESFSSEDLEKLHQISGVKAQPVDQGSEARGSQPETVQEAHMFRPELPVPGKARSKRSRAAPRTWTSRLLLLSPTAATVSSSVKSAASGGYGRRCVHCAADKTPQWRSGPTGPKTLCNACGVRYKSGRLVPEYRPAASPTFTLTRHSNSHRKVLELRRQKEMIGPHHRPPFVHPNVIFDQVTSGEDYLIHQHVGPDFRQLI